MSFDARKGREARRDARIGKARGEGALLADGEQHVRLDADDERLLDARAQ